MPLITEIYSFTAINGEDDEGIIGIQTISGWMPLIGADMKRVEQLRPIAKQIGEATGKKIKLKKFRLVEEMEL